MFVEDILIDIQKTLPLVNNKMFNMYRTKVRDLLRRLPTTQKFFVGEYKPFIENTLKEGHILFMDIEDIRLPYQTCWFSFTGTKSWADHIAEDNRISRGGIMVTEISRNLLHIDSFTVYANRGFWQFDPVSSMISINKPIKENPIAIRVLSWLDARMEKIASEWTDNVIPISYVELPEDVIYDIQRTHMCHFIVLEKAMMLLSCKNISTEFHEISEHLNKKRRKKGKPDLFSYHTLVLKPTDKRQESIPQHLWNNRIHLCRGHFKTFTEEKPLFGKITGRFWWQPNVRGGNKKGVIMKDYAFES